MDPVTSAPSFRFTTIAQVDAAVEADASPERINSEGIPEYIGSRLTAFEIPVFERSLEFRRLTLLKYFYGLSQEVTRAHARERECNREAARRSPKSPRIYLDAFRKAFRDINDASGDAFGHKVRRFLDLGCAPGGFATWLLKNNKKAQGTGITLSSEAKGLRLQLEPSLRGRFQVHYEDVCRVAMGRVALGMCFHAVRVSWPADWERRGLTEARVRPCRGERIVHAGGQQGAVERRDRPDICTTLVGVPTCGDQWILSPQHQRTPAALGGGHHPDAPRRLQDGHGSEPPIPGQEVFHVPRMPEFSGDRGRAISVRAPPPQMCRISGKYQ